MQREKINLSTTTMDLIMQMSEGNPGALSVIVQLLKEGPMGLMDILNLDDMGMRGSQIWCGYKDHCKQDINAFRQALRDRDPAMVATVNASCGHAPETPAAVTSGASYR